MVLAGGKGDLGAEVRGRDLEAQVAVVLGHRPVHLVDEDDVGLTSGEARLDQLLEEGAGVDGGPDAVVFGRFQIRSEERRGGTEGGSKCRSRWSTYPKKKKNKKQNN